MANTFNTIDWITKEALRHFQNNCVFSRMVNRQYDNQYNITGASSGNAIRIRRPNRFYVNSGANLVAANYTESNVSLTLANQINVAVEFTSAELATDIARERYSEYILKPAAAALAANVDAAGLALALKLYNSVGTPGVAPLANAANNTFVEAASMLSDYSTPEDNLRNMVINPRAQTVALIRSQALFNPGGDLSSNYRKGQMSGAPVYGMNWGMDQNVNSYTTGTRANGTVDGANQTGTTLDITGAGNAATITVGDSFTIANVFAVNPVTQAASSVEQQFTVQAAATMDANGANTITIEPGIVVAAANVANGTVSALPANGAALTWLGNASTTSSVNVAFHRDAFVLGTIDLPKPDVGISSIMNYDGISMRVWKSSVISTDMHPLRIDILYGWATTLPEYACKVFGV